MSIRKKSQGNCIQGRIPQCICTTGTKKGIVYPVVLSCHNGWHKSTVLSFISLFQYLSLPFSAIYCDKVCNIGNENKNSHLRRRSARLPQLGYQLAVDVLRDLLVQPPAGVVGGDVEPNETATLEEATADLEKKFL